MPIEKSIFPNSRNGLIDNVNYKVALLKVSKYIQENIIYSLI